MNLLGWQFRSHWRHSRCRVTALLTIAGNTVTAYIGEDNIITYLAPVRDLTGLSPTGTLGCIRSRKAEVPLSRGNPDGVRFIGGMLIRMRRL